MADTEIMLRIVILQRETALTTLAQVATELELAQRRIKELEAMVPHANPAQAEG